MHNQDSSNPDSVPREIKKRSLKDFFIQMLRPYKNNESVVVETRLIDGYTHHKKLIEFRIYFANGGKIIEISHYDNKSGDRNFSLHVIGNDNSIGESIDKILTFEGMK